MNKFHNISPMGTSDYFQVLWREKESYYSVAVAAHIWVWYEGWEKPSFSFALCIYFPRGLYGNDDPGLDRLYGLCVDISTSHSWLCVIIKLLLRWDLLCEFCGFLSRARGWNGRKKIVRNVIYWQYCTLSKFPIIWVMRNGQEWLNEIHALPLSWKFFGHLVCVRNSLHGMHHVSNTHLASQESHLSQLFQY